MADKWFFTFCGAHFCKEYGRLDNKYVVVEGSMMEARATMFNAIGQAWGFQYPIADLEKQQFDFGLTEVELDKIGEVYRD